MSIKIDMLGIKKGMLLPIENVGSNARGEAFWKCLCDCGKEIIIRGYTLRHCHPYSCGCCKKSDINETQTITKVNDTEYLEVLKEHVAALERVKELKEKIESVANDRSNPINL